MDETPPRIIWHDYRKPVPKCRAGIELAFQVRKQKSQWQVVKITKDWKEEVVAVRDTEQEAERLGRLLASQPLGEEG